jgi:zinc/manganese transport system permease protein
LVGATIFTFSRFRDGRVPQEAIIGIVYAVSTAVALLILSKTAVGKEEIEVTVHAILPVVIRV